MTELPTKQEYQALSENMTFPCNTFFDGNFHAAESANAFSTLNPTTGEKLADAEACDAAEEDGHRLVPGGNPGNSNMIEATIHELDCNQNSLDGEETFGPVLFVLMEKSNEQAIALASDSPYLLGATIFSGNAKTAIRAAGNTRADIVTIIGCSESDISIAFEGFRRSNFAGRDNSIHSHNQHTQLKTIWIDLGDQDTDDTVQ